MVTLPVADVRAVTYISVCVGHQRTVSKLTLDAARNQLVAALAHVHSRIGKEALAADAPCARWVESEPVLSLALRAKAIIVKACDRVVAFSAQVFSEAPLAVVHAVLIADVAPAIFEEELLVALETGGTIAPLAVLIAEKALTIF